MSQIVSTNTIHKAEPRVEELCRQFQPPEVASLVLNGSLDPPVDPSQQLSDVIFPNDLSLPINCPVRMVNIEGGRNLDRSDRREDDRYDATLGA